MIKFIVNVDRNFYDKADLLDRLGDQFFSLFFGSILGSTVIFDQLNLGLIFGFAGIVCWILLHRTGVNLREIRAAEKRDALRYRGVYPLPGQGSNDDVKRLKGAGYKAMAWTLYRELHAGSVLATHEAFEAL